LGTLNEQCLINLHTGVVEFDGVNITLRPKTFELLAFLAKTPGEIVSKTQILESVWSDSVVEEQVVFQSINEIRKSINSPGIIKTFPKKGYAWQCHDTRIISEQPGAKSGSSTTFTPFFKAMAIASILSVILIAIFVFFLFEKPKSGGEIENISPAIQTETNSQNISVKHEGVLILPFNVSLLQKSEQWLRYGAMQGVIDRIRPLDGITLFLLEDVLDIVNRLSPNERNDISNIFNKSGASIILETKISGVPGDYNIVFSIYTPRTVDTKSLNVKDINEAIHLLAQEFNQITSPTTSTNLRATDSKLQDSLIAKAIGLLEINDYESALAFLETAVASDKTNLYAHYLFSKVALTVGKFDLALKSSKSSLELNSARNSSRYYNRLLFIFASASLIQSHYDVAEKVLQEAAHESEKSKDWLYLSYAQSMLGKYHQYKNNYGDAKQYFESALKYQELLKCPMGIAQTNLDLAEFYIAQGMTDQAKANMQISESLIEEHHLTQAQEDLLVTKSKLE